MSNKQDNAEVDLYDRLRQNPSLIEGLENSFANKVVRSGSFELQPVNLIEIPDREVLDKNMFDRYGIPNISRYFVPMIVDTMTYRSLQGMGDPSLSDGVENFFRSSGIREGHVKKVGNYFISYICSSLPIDTSIEHEGVHAFMFNQNPYYKTKAPEFGPSWLFPISPEDRGWIEAVAWVSTSDEVDKDSIAKRYNLFNSNLDDIVKKLKIIALSPVYNILSAMVKSHSKIKQDMGKDVPFVLANSIYSQIHYFHLLLPNQQKVLKSWDESFELAADLKRRYGVKDFIKLVGEKTRDELAVLK